jgi:tRNA A22 N-methylase
MSISKELPVVYHRVKRLLKQSKDCRDNDKLLILQYLNKYHNLRNILGKAAYRVVEGLIFARTTPCFETIRRCRQLIQEKGYYHGKLRKKRLAEAKKIKAWLRTK